MAFGEEGRRMRKGERARIIIFLLYHHHPSTLMSSWKKGRLVISRTEKRRGQCDGTGRQKGKSTRLERETRERTKRKETSWKGGHLCQTESILLSLPPSYLCDTIRKTFSCLCPSISCFVFQNTRSRKVQLSNNGIWDDRDHNGEGWRDKNGDESSPLKLRGSSLQNYTLPKGCFWSSSFYFVNGTTSEIFHPSASPIFTFLAVQRKTSFCLMFDGKGKWKHLQAIQRKQ